MSSESYKLTYFDGRGLAERSRFMFAIGKQKYTDERLSFDNFREKKQNSDAFSVAMGRLPILTVTVNKNSAGLAFKNHESNIKEIINGNQNLNSTDPNFNSTESVTQTDLGNEFQIPQSKSIERYLAKKFGLLGQTPIEEAQIDSVAEHQRDLRDAFGKVDGLEKGKEKDDKIKAFFEGKFVDEMKLIEKALPRVQVVESSSNSNDTHTFLFGSKISYADIAWYQFFFEFFTSEEEKMNVKKVLEMCPRFKTAMTAVENHPEVRAWREKRPKTEW